MLNLSKLKVAILLPLLMLLTVLPGFLFIEGLQAKDNCFERDIHKNRTKKNMFKLKAFEGSWVLISQSTGGVSGTTGNSSNLIGHIKLDRLGRGVEGFAQQVLYTGPIGTDLTVQNFTGNNADVTLTIIDKESGIIKIDIVDSITGRNMSYTFIALRFNGKVVELIGHDTLMPLPSSVQSVRLIRQDN